MTEPMLPEQIGRYHVVRLLGEGAMGRVLLAHDPVLDRSVALKHMRNDLGIPEDQQRALIERMRQEARASARVSHPNIVALHDMGEDPELGLYLVFEYVEGKTLKDKLMRGALGPQAAARLARELGDALTTAHAAGVLHRDIKPENVILARSGGKIADFGIARVPNSTLTKNRKLLGTPAYSAPESVSHGEFSPLTDQFSMAATLLEGISGRRAFPGDDAMTVATRITTEEPPRIAELCGLDPHVDTVLSRALSKDPRARFPSCQEFGRALSEALDLAPRTVMHTMPDEYHRAAIKQMKRGPGLALGGAVVGAAIAVGGLQVAGWLKSSGRVSTDTLVADGGSPEATLPNQDAPREHPNRGARSHVGITRAARRSHHSNTRSNPMAHQAAVAARGERAHDGGAREPTVTAKTDTNRDAGTRTSKPSHRDRIGHR